MFNCLTTDGGEVYTWGWKECVPSGKVFGEPSTGLSLEKDVPDRHRSFLTEQGMPELFIASHFSRAASRFREIGLRV